MKPPTEFRTGSSSSKYSVGQDECRPLKRLRVEGESTFEGQGSANTRLNTPQAEEGQEEVDLKVVRKESEEELREKIKRLEQEAHSHRAALAALTRATEALNCAVCHNAIRNPQVMACGHAGCYKCLRNWWTMAEPDERRGDDENEISTDGDSDSGDDDKEELEHNAKDTSHSAPKGSSKDSFSHSRFRFLPVTSRPKRCPECKRTIHHRPIPDFQLRHIVDALRIVPLSPEAQAARDKRWGRRSDIWRGIFPIEGVETGQTADGNSTAEMEIARAEAEEMRQHMDAVLRMLDDARAGRREFTSRQGRRPRLSAEEIANLQARHPGLPRFDPQWAEEGVGDVLGGTVPPRERAPSPEVFQMGSRLPSPPPPHADIFVGVQLQSLSQQPEERPTNSDLSRSPVEPLNRSSDAPASVSHDVAPEIEVEAMLRYPEDPTPEPPNTGEVAGSGSP